MKMYNVEMIYKDQKMSKSQGFPFAERKVVKTFKTKRAAKSWVEDHYDEYIITRRDFEDFEIVEVEEEEEHLD